MSYTNATFYLNYATGSDATRTTLTSVTASNPSGSITRLNKTAHGLVTGAVVTTSLFTTWLNGDWKITVVDADNFDLDGAVWQATADTSGSVVPFGGSSWADAWKDITTGPTAARIAPGDTIRIAKSTDPVNIGNGTWTNKSATITLASALTATVDLCESNWTAANSATCATSTTRKQGTVAQQVTLPGSGVASNTLYAYKTITSTDFSAYDSLTFWFRSVTTGTAANNWKVCLCSDTAGTTIVDEFVVPATTATGQYFPVTVAKVSALGSAIQSVALYTGSSAPANSSVILIDDILACDAGSLNLQSLISKSDGTGTEPFLAIQSISGTTVLLDVSTNTAANGTNRGYSGTTETATTYIRETIKTAMTGGTTNAIFSVQDSGTAGNPITFSGGWNTSSNLQDGQSYFDGLNGYGIAFNPNAKLYINAERLSFTRYYHGVSTSSGVSVGIMGNNLSFQDLNNMTQYGFYGATNGGSHENWGTVTIVNCCNNGGGGVHTGYHYGTTFNLTNCNSNITNNIFAQGVMGAPNIINFTNCNNSSAQGLNYSNGVVTGTNCKDNNNYCIQQALGVADKLSCINGVTFSGNGTSSISDTSNIGNPAIIYLNNCALNDSTEVTNNTNANNNLIVSKNHDQTAGYNKIFTMGGVIETETTVVHTVGGKSWKMRPTSTYRNATFPLFLDIIKFAVSASALVTVKAWMRRSNTGLTMSLVCRGGQIAGVPSNVVSSMTAAANTWEEVTITFTPSEAGVVTIEAWAYGGTTYSGYVDDLTRTQA